MINIAMPDLTQAQWIIHGLVFACNLLLLFFAKPVIHRIDPGQDHSTALRFFVTINVLFLVLHVFDLLLMTITTSYENLFIKMAHSALCFYASVLIFKVGNVFFRKRFGRVKTFEDETIYLDSYSSRIVELIFLVVVFLLTIYTLIKIWDMDSLLETTGIFGIIIGFIALTSNAWGP